MELFSLEFKWQTFGAYVIPFICLFCLYFSYVFAVQQNRNGFLWLLISIIYNSFTCYIVYLSINEEAPLLLAYMSVSINLIHLMTLKTSSNPHLEERYGIQIKHLKEDSALLRQDVDQLLRDKIEPPESGGNPF